MPKYIIIAIALIIALIIAWNTYHYTHAQSYGTVIILNGPSAAGKSSIQREFQHLAMPQLWIKVGIDNLFDKPMPDITMENISFWQQANTIRWVETDQDTDQNNIITLFTGPDGDKVAHGMNSAIAAYAKEGCNIIVDYIAYKKEWIEDLQHKLYDIKTYRIKVEIPLTTLEEREVARGTSPKGHARSHYDTVHWDIKYDLVVNSGKNSAQEIAQQIKDQLRL